MGLGDTLIGVGLFGIGLFYSQGLINEARLDLLATSPDGVIFNFILLMLIPILWLIYLVIAAISIRKAITSVE